MVKSPSAMYRRSANVGLYIKHERFATRLTLLVRDINFDLLDTVSRLSIFEILRTSYV